MAERAMDRGAGEGRGVAAPELIIYNGKLHTQDSARPQASAAAVADGRFLAVGDDAEVLELGKAGTRQIDLGGRLVVPGFVDAHVHFRSWALGRRQLSLVDAGSRGDVRRRVAAEAEERVRGRWIVGEGWNESRWANPQMPARADLDEAAPHHPVMLWRSDGHLAVVNTLALREAGIDAETLDPPQGRIDRDSSGEPTGVLRELAVNLVRDVIPAPSEAETLTAMREGIAELHRLGLTGLHDHRNMGGGDGQRAFRAYERLRVAGELDLRLWMGIPGERLGEAVALGLRSGFGDRFLRVGHVKLFADGSEGARTAWMLEPYEDTGDVGMPLTPMSEVAEAVRQADEAGLSVAVHAIGDRTNRELIQVFEKQVSRGGRRIPHRIEHAQVIRPADVERLSRLPVVASVQPIHVTDDLPMSDVALGRRARFCYPFRDMLDAGVPLAFGSDAPVADPNPLWGIHAAVTRQRRDDTPAGGWYPEQRLSVAEAVWGFTMGPAVASGQAAQLGSITPGKLADLVVLDRDILSIHPIEIHAVRVGMTIFDGRVVYEG